MKTIVTFLCIYITTPPTWVHAVAQLLRHCATNRKVAGSISDGIIGIFHRHTRIPSGRTMVLGSTQPLTEMSTRKISWGKGGRCIGLTTLSPSCADFLKIRDPQPSGTLRSVMWLIYHWFYTANIKKHQVANATHGPKVRGVLFLLQTACCVR
jgi:hypothetical protein